MWGQYSREHSEGQFLLEVNIGNLEVKLVVVRFEALEPVIAGHARASKAEDRAAKHGVGQLRPDEVHHSGFVLFCPLGDLFCQHLQDGVALARSASLRGEDQRSKRALLDFQNSLQVFLLLLRLLRCLGLVQGLGDVLGSGRIEDPDVKECSFVHSPEPQT